MIRLLLIRGGALKLMFDKEDIRRVDVLFILEIHTLLRYDTKR